MSRRLWNAALSLLLAGVCSVTVTGQPPTSTDGFVRMRPDQLGQEQLPAAPLVYAAYSFVWLAFVTYVFLLWRRLSRVERELGDLTARAERPRR